MKPDFTWDHFRTWGEDMKGTIELNGENGILFLSSLIEIKVGKQINRRICILSDRAIVTTGHWAMSIPIDNEDDSEDKVFGWIDLLEGSDISGGIKRILKQGNGQFLIEIDKDNNVYLKCSDSIKIGELFFSGSDIKSFTDNIFRAIACYGSDTVTRGAPFKFDVSVLSTYERIIKRVHGKGRLVIALWNDGSKIFIEGGRYTVADGNIPSFVFMPVEEWRNDD